MPIARGGMGEVWLARLQRSELSFKKLVAIKLVLPQYAAEPRFHAMFMDEGRVAAQISHPNVAQVLDIGTVDDMLYMVFEWVNGDSLQTLARTLDADGDRPDVAVVLRILADAARGLHAIHEVKDESGEYLAAVHRDISPHNIMVDASGTAKVIDLGVAKSNNRASGETTSGSIRGKVRYMSPEQTTGISVDRRTDIWAMGVVLQFMLTGRFPYDGENDVVILTQLATRQKPWTVTDEVSDAVRSVVCRCLAVERGARFATAAALSEALEEVIANEFGSISSAEVGEYLGEKLKARSANRELRVRKALADLPSSSTSGPFVGATGSSEFSASSVQSSSFRSGAIRVATRRRVWAWLALGTGVLALVSATGFAAYSRATEPVSSLSTHATTALRAMPPLPRLRPAPTSAPSASPYVPLPTQVSSGKALSPPVSRTPKPDEPFDSRK